MLFRILALATVVITVNVGAQAPRDTTKKSPPIVIKLVDSLSMKDSTVERSLGEPVRTGVVPRGPSRSYARAGVGRQKTFLAIPKDAMIEKYPIVPESISDSEMKKFGLHLDTLDVSWTGLNWFRNVGRFAYDGLPAGTVVYVDANGIPRYKADCKNRLVELTAMVDAMRSTGTETVDSLPPWIKEILDKGIDVNLSVPDEFYRALEERRVNYVERSWWDDNDQWVIPAAIGTAVAMIVFKPFSNKNVVKIGY